MQPIFDSHAHYDDERFDPDREELIASLPGSGVELVLNAACDLPSCESSLALTRRWPFFYCSVGVHPHAAQEVAGSDYLHYLERAARENEKAVAIGEIGLDYHYDFSPREVQKAVFDEQMALAEALDLPVIIHSREASADTLEIVRRHRCRGVVHCFSGSAETAREYLKLGYHIGFTGSVTFKNAKKPVEAAAQVPLERLLIETDCPYMAPVPLRGKRCDSRMVSHTAARLAEIKGVEVEEILRATNENARRLFAIPD